MLCLACESNPEWVDVAIAHPDNILVDHALCEKKAAAFAMAMINRYPDKTRMVLDMIDLAKEELEHLETVVRILTARGITMAPDAGNEYAQQLHGHIRDKSRIACSTHSLLVHLSKRAHASAFRFWPSTQQMTKCEHSIPRCSQARLATIVCTPILRGSTSQSTRSELAFKSLQ